AAAAVVGGWQFPLQEEDRVDVGRARHGCRVDAIGVTDMSGEIAVREGTCPRVDPGVGSGGVPGAVAAGGDVLEAKELRGERADMPHKHHDGATAAHET